MQNFLNFLKAEGNREFSISEIKNHLKIYEKIYLDTQALFEVSLFNFCESFELQKKYPKELLFKKQYSHLLDFCKISENEDYFRQELDYYYDNQDNEEILKQMVIKNRELCESLIYSFIVNYQDDEESNKRNFWLVGFNQHWEDHFYFKVSKREFLKTLEFLNIFYELFWDRKVYPEAIEAIEAIEEIEKYIEE